MAVLEAVCREYGIDTSVVYEKGNNRKNSEVRAMMAMIIQDIEGITLTSLAEALSRDLSALSQSAGRLRKRMYKTPSLQGKADKIMDAIKTPICQA